MQILLGHSFSLPTTPLLSKSGSGFLARTANKVSSQASCSTRRGYSNLKRREYRPREQTVKIDGGDELQLSMSKKHSSTHDSETGRQSRLLDISVIEMVGAFSPDRFRQGKYLREPGISISPSCQLRLMVFRHLVS